MRPWENYEIAANGRPIKDNFADWFEGSKVVDADGQPLVVYHGTDKDFSTFQVGGHGAFFSVAKGAACAYALGPDDYDSEARDGANVIAVYLSLQNPLVVTNEWLNDFARRAPADPFSRGHIFRDDFVDSEIYARDAVVAEAKRLGHDGLILPFDMLPVGSMNGDWEEQIAYAAFHPSQIKSAIGNSGLYNKNSTSIADLINHQQPEINSATVRISDIVPHETPNPRAVAKIAKAIRAGEDIPPIIIDRNACKHWTQGPEGMVFTGYGYGLLDGHHRLEAYRRVFGPDHLLEVELHKAPTAKAMLNGFGL